VALNSKNTKKICQGGAENAGPENAGPENGGPSMNAASLHERPTTVLENGLPIRRPRRKQQLQNDCRLRTCVAKYGNDTDAVSPCCEPQRHARSAAADSRRQLR